jgi:predicted transcriptional regulator
MFLMARLDFENWIQVTQQEISEKISIKKSNVSRAIALLENKGIILRGPKAGRSYAFRLNPYYGWKGKVRNLNDYRNKEDDQERRETLRNHLKAVETPTQSDD